ncbi:uncharacterized protein V6R79_000591, partial [Siganus canaliculatus]
NTTRRGDKQHFRGNVSHQQQQQQEAARSVQGADAWLCRSPRVTSHHPAAGAWKQRGDAWRQAEGANESTNQGRDAPSGRGRDVTLQQLETAEPQIQNGGSKKSIAFTWTGDGDDYGSLKAT